VRRKRILLIVTGILVIEAAVILAIPARVPRSARVVTAATNLIAAAAIWTFARQSSGR
jgi:hypothetical protein